MTYAVEHLTREIAAETERDRLPRRFAAIDPAREVYPVVVSRRLRADLEALRARGPWRATA